MRLKTVIDFLIEKKKEGQFRVIWTGFEQAVNLLDKQGGLRDGLLGAHGICCRNQGPEAVYADPKEGYLLWAMAAYWSTTPSAGRKNPGSSRFIELHVGTLVWCQNHRYARLHDEPQAAEYAKTHPDEFSAEEARRWRT